MTQSNLTPEDELFLEGYDSSAFAHPSLTVDVVVATVKDGSLWVLLTKRMASPHRGFYALPGGFVALNESLDAAASRILHEKAGLDDVYLEQLYTFGRVDRDPRTRIVTITYLALVPATKLTNLPRGVFLSRVLVDWAGETGGPAHALFPDPNPGAYDVGELVLAFDHDEIIGLAVKRLRGKLNYAPVGYELLGRDFPLRDLQAIHEAILDRRLNKDSFRRTILARAQVTSTGRHETNVKFRPAELYRFTRPPVTTTLPKNKSKEAS